MVRGLRAVLNASGRYKFVEPELAVDHVVIGAGVVGLAIGARLARLRPDKTTFVLERHDRAGEETSSEVLHAGIYYPPNSLKTRFCVRGRQLLKQYCDAHSIPHAFPGKLVVGLSRQREYLTRLHAHSKSLSEASLCAPPPRTLLLSGDEARELQPDLPPDIAYALHSLDTGIVDSHALMQALEAEIQDAEQADVVYRARVVRVDPAPDGWVVQTVSGDEARGNAVLARTLVNASGLSASLVLNAFLQPHERVPMFFARGSYAAYRGPGVSRVSMLLYPVPTKDDRNAHAFHSLGTHLTLDMGGNVRFGPDLEWIEPPSRTDDEFSDAEGDVDFWTKHLMPEDSEEKIHAICQAVHEYLPGITNEGLRMDYVGIRPKIVGPLAGFQDFVLRRDFSGQFKSTSKGRGAPMITLLGIESPGLTGCLAIAEHVEAMMPKTR